LFDKKNTVKRKYSETLLLQFQATVVYFNALTVRLLDAFLSYHILWIIIN